MTIKETAQNSMDTDMKEALKRPSVNDKTKKNLITFISHFYITQR